MTKALCTMMAGYELPYIKEFVDYYATLGFDLAYIYCNNWQKEDLEYWRITPFSIPVYLTEWNGDVQILPVYNDCLRRAARENVDWLGVFDTDEFLTVRSSRSVNDILLDNEDKLSLAISWRLHGSNGIEERDISLPIRDSFPLCGKNRDRHIKQFVHISKMKQLGITPHFLNPHFGDFNSHDLAGNIIKGPWSTFNLENVAEMELDHYITKSHQECIRRRSAPRADCPTPHDAEKFFIDHDVNEVDYRTLAYSK